jgi:Peptidase family S41
MFRACSVLLVIVLSLLPALAQTTPVSSSDAAKWREDLRYMAEQMPQVHKNLFHTMTRIHFDEAIKKLDERIPALGRHQIIVEMARIVAMVGDGHTNISPTRDPKIAFRTYPVKMYFFKDGLYIRAAARENADLAGSKIIKIGNATAGQAYAAVRELIGRDNEMGARFFAPHLLAMPEVLQALGLIDNMEEARFTVESSGRRRVVTLKPLGPADMLPPDTDTTWISKEGWTDARTGRAPLWLEDPLDKFRFKYLPETKTVYVQYNQVGNKENETIEDFSRRLFAFVDANPVDHLVLDLRLNRGGNGDLNRPLLLGIIKCAKVDQRGKLFTLIGRGTWSAAQFMVNDLERLTNTIFIGEPTGGKINHYGDSRKITLPNSGITVRVSTLWWQEDERDTRQWTAPEIAAELTFEEYRNGIDPALNAALNYTPQKPLREVLLGALSAGGATAATEQFRAWKADPRNAYADVEERLNTLGYQLLTAKRFEEAIAIFKLNTETCPRSANALDSLAEAYAASGNKELALQTYEKANQLNPKLDSAIQALKKLRSQ